MSKNNLTVTWFGHSAFLLESVSGKRVLLDPWLDNPIAPPWAKEVSNIHLVCVTHGHDDHLGSTADIAQRTGATVICIHEVALHLRSKGVKDLHGINMGGTVRVGGVQVTMTYARHSSSIDEARPPLPGGMAAGFVLRFENGFTVYHAGDTSLFGDMEWIGNQHKPDLALLPIGDYYTMGPAEAAAACSLIKPKAVIGMHYGTGPALTGTPEQFRDNLPVPLRKAHHILTPGIPLTF